MGLTQPPWPKDVWRYKRGRFWRAGRLQLKTIFGWRDVTPGYYIVHDLDSDTYWPWESLDFETKFEIAAERVRGDAQ